MRLGLGTMAACRPIPFTEDDRASIARLGREILKAAGTSLSNVVVVTTYLKHASMFDDYNDEYDDDNCNEYDDNNNDYDDERNL